MAKRDRTIETREENNINFILVSEKAPRLKTISISPLKYIVPADVYDTIFRGGFIRFAIELMLSLLFCRDNTKIAINTAYSAATDCITAEGSQKVPAVLAAELPVLSFPERVKKLKITRAKIKKTSSL
ncbi:MAG TPA: hypothetical protein VN373_03670 [Methanosarcina barkeri]|nr:hypothetical protein [Methanosarcina barkeri]